MKLTNHIPNGITMLNLFAGCFATLWAFEGQYAAAFFAILVAAFLDFLDGTAARVLHAYSALGKELDSLADVISFGLAPGAMVYSMLLGGDYPEWVAGAGFLIPVFSALRLAKFNIDDKQHSSFIGLPTPANAIFWGGAGYSFNQWLTQTPEILLLLVVVFSTLLVSRLPMFSLKISGFGWTENRTQYVFLAGCVVLIIAFGWNAFAPVILWYLVSSISLFRWLKST